MLTPRRRGFDASLLKRGRRGRAIIIRLKAAVDEARERRWGCEYVSSHC